VRGRGWPVKGCEGMRRDVKGCEGGRAVMWIKVGRGVLQVWKLAIILHS
jgi:hypothetical protein